MSSQPHLFLIDGYGFLFRAYHSLPPLTNPQGVPVGALYGFTNMLLKLRGRVQENAHHHMLVVFDAGKKTFRNDMYAAYKANRPPAPDDLIPQFELVRDAASALNLQHISKVGYEADDIIATYAKQAQEANMKVTIVSSDKDLMQLVNDQVSMYDAMKDRAIGPKEVEEKFGVPPAKVQDVLALMGDSSDNIPGVPGIGPKTAAELIVRFGDVETVLAHTAEITQKKRREMLETHADDARLSKELVALDSDVVLELGLDQLHVKTLDETHFSPFLTQHGFGSLLTKLGKLGAEIPAPSAQKSGGLLAKPAAEIPIKAHGLLTEAAGLSSFLSHIENTGYLVYLPIFDHKIQLYGTALAIMDDSQIHTCFLPYSAENSPAEPHDDLFSVAEAPPASLHDQLPHHLTPYVQRADIKLIAWDAKQAMHLLGHVPMHYEDITLMRNLTDGPRGEQSIMAYAEQYLGSSAGLSHTKQKEMGKMEPEALTSLAEESAALLWQLYQHLSCHVVQAKQQQIYLGLERPLSRVLFNMEQRGIMLDTGKLQHLSQYFSTHMAEAEAKIYAASGKHFNIGSPKQLGEMLFEEMGIAGAKKTKTGAYKTGSDVLELLSEQGHAIADHVLRWRSLSKLKSTYSDALMRLVDPRSQRIHTTFGMTHTNTGRLSSFDPNLQNIPIRTEEGRRIRSCFVAQKGHVLICADYSQIELRLLAHMAEITPLQQAFLQGHDIHAATASEMFGVPLEQMDSDTRRKAKAINFGIIYGQSAFGLASQLGISREEAKNYIAAYFQKYPGIRHYMDETKEYARTHGYVRTLLGRICHMPDIQSKNGALRQFAERAAINAPLQGTAADIIKRAMIRIDQELPWPMLLQVHDELVFEVPEAEAEKAAAQIKHIMEHIMQLSVPLIVDTNHASTWREAH